MMLPLLLLALAPVANAAEAPKEPKEPNEPTVEELLQASDPLPTANYCAACSCSCPGGAVIPATPRTDSPELAGADNLPAPSGTPKSSFHHKHGKRSRYSIDESAQDAGNYPSAYVDRLTLLPEDVTQVELAANFFKDATNPAQSVRERIQLGFQSRIAENLQAGALINVAIQPKVSLGSLYGVLQYGTSPFVNARLDFGIRKLACGGDDRQGFSGGVGLPFQFKIAPGLAVIGARTFAYSGMADDLVTWDLGGCHPTGTVGVPLGLYATLFDDTINLGLRSGYRKLFGSSTSVSFVPVGFDFAVSVARQADIGVTLELPNQLGAPSFEDVKSSYAFEQRLFFFAQTRL